VEKKKARFQRRRRRFRARKCSLLWAQGYPCSPFVYVKYYLK
jgi:hypothetical protein